MCWLICKNTNDNNVKFATVLHNNNKRIVFISFWCLAIIIRTATATNATNNDFLSVCVMLAFFSSLHWDSFGNWRTHTGTYLHSNTPMRRLLYSNDFQYVLVPYFFSFSFAILIYKRIQFLAVTHTFRPILGLADACYVTNEHWD